MRTEYDFTTAQKAELRKIDEQIEQLNNQIFALCMARANILMQARCRYVFDTEEEAQLIRRAVTAGIFNEPVVQKQGVFKFIDIDE